jgi:hypothetical protein
MKPADEVIALRGTESGEPKFTEFSLHGVPIDTLFQANPSHRKTVPLFPTAHPSPAPTPPVPPFVMNTEFKVALGTAVYSVGLMLRQFPWEAWAGGTQLSPISKAMIRIPALNNVLGLFKWNHFLHYARYIYALLRATHLQLVTKAS